MLEAKPLTFFWRHWNCLEWGETSIAVFRYHMSLHAILSTKRFLANRTEPTHVNSSEAECRLRKRWNVAHLYRFTTTTTTTTTTTFLLFSSTNTTTFLLFSSSTTTFRLFSSTTFNKDCKLLSLVYFVAMSHVVKNNHGFLQQLAVCPAHQRQFLLRTTTPQQLHRLV